MTSAWAARRLAVRAALSCDPFAHAVDHEGHPEPSPLGRRVAVAAANEADPSCDQGSATVVALTRYRQWRSPAFVTRHCRTRSFPTAITRPPVENPGNVAPPPL